MKGIIFESLQELIEDKFGFALWNQIVDQCPLSSNGIYVATKSYPDEELFAIVGRLSELTKLEINILVKEFGRYIFPRLMASAPESAREAVDLRTFLKMVDEVIHVEVRKLYADSNLPDFTCSEAESVLTMYYRSPRKLCFLSEGLIEAAAEHFDEPVSLSQPVCMHSGSDYCEIKVKFG